MKAFSDYNPITVFVTLMCAAGVCMFSTDPVLLLLSLMGAAALFFARHGFAAWRSCWWYSLIFLLSLVLNPLFNHNGMTVLFVLNNNPITLEALCFGAVMGAMIVGVMWWFLSFSGIMSSDKLLYIFGSVSPKLALILSMTLRYVPLFRRQAVKTHQAQKALGLYKEDSIPDTLRGGLRVFSVMVTWALENGVITADSMTARGYGVGRRSHFAIFRFRREDAALLALTVLLTGLTLAGLGLGAVGWVFYPRLMPPELSAMSYLAYFAYGLLCLLPATLEILEAIKWKSLRSAI